MNEAQRFWWEQSRSDHATFVVLRQAETNPCQLLHYLQMATEKIAKAYLWRSGSPPPRSHVGFMSFLRALTTRNRTDLRRIARTFDFGRPKDMEVWMKQISPLAHELQNLAPAQANDGPNPEYPWPHDDPVQCPALYSFPLWARLRDDRRGRDLLRFVRNSVDRFEQYA